MEPMFKQHIRIHGLNHNLAFEKDKVGKAQETFWERHAKDEEKKKALQNRHLDPLYMECNIPDAPDTGSISLDPNDMTFNF